MKNNTNTHWGKLLFLGLGMVGVLSCERDFSDEVQFATFSVNGEIYTDDPVGLTDEFFESFDPEEGYDTDAFDTTSDEAYEGSASIRIDVPSADNPNGFQVGGIFRDRGDGRNLTQFDALTFWLKGSTTATVAEFGFGTDFDTTDPFAVKLTNVRLTTNWEKVIIPIPDPSKLTQERGLFSFIAGSLSTGGAGYTFWIDELRFEKLGTIGQPRPSILGGNNSQFPSIVGQTLNIAPLRQTFNLGSGRNQTVQLAPSYFDFMTSNPSVAVVNDLGQLTVVGLGSAEITAAITGVLAEGGVLVESSETAQIISLFSDLFTDVPVDNFNGFFVGSTTQGGAFDENDNPFLDVDGNHIIRYTNLNFVSINFFSEENRINASEMTNLSLQIRVDEAVDPDDFIRLELNNFLNGQETGSSFTIPSTELMAGEWVTFDIPLSDFQGLTDRSGLGLLFFVTDGTIANISVDNIFFSVQ
ncbi:MAG: carbohydrate-binding protein [Bacteroidota bacterium]